MRRVDARRVAPGADSPAPAALGARATLRHLVAAREGAALGTPVALVHQLGMQTHALQDAPKLTSSTALSVTLIRRQRVARDTYAFVFHKPLGFQFLPGQAIDLSLEQPDGGAATTHAFSIVSAPYEPDLVIATRGRDTAFKRQIERLHPGERATIDGPFGSLCLHANPSRPAVFIAGGIGITPFISILRQATHDHSEQVLSLLYSNRQLADAAFLTELEEYERDHRGRFVLRATITGPLPPGSLWAGDRGRIDAALIDAVVVPPSAPMFYLAGPPSMVAGMQSLLRGMGIPDEDVVAEAFSGYEDAAG